MSLPSYSDATTSLEFWSATAEDLTFYLGSNDLGSLCLVSRRFRDLFTRSLWRNPLRSVFSGNPAHGMERLHSFLHGPKVGPQELVEILDFREAQAEKRALSVPLAVAGHGSQHLSNAVLEAFPNAKFVIIDDTDIIFESDGPSRHENQGLWHIIPVNSSSGSASGTRSRSSNILFSAARCPYVSSGHAVQMAFCHSTLYLDLSYASDIDAFVRYATLDRLSRLRILKLRGTKLTNSGLKKLGDNLDGALWSLDVRDNLLSMPAVETLESAFGFTGEVVDRSLPIDWRVLCSDHWGSMINDPHVLTPIPQDGPDTGQRIPEDCLPAENLLWDPSRYFADPPTYDEATAHESGPVTFVGNPSDFRPDTADGVMKWFDVHPDSLASYNKPHEIRDSLSKTTGLTHLRISGNKVPIERFLARSSKLQLLDCDVLLTSPPPSHWNDFPDPNPLALTSRGLSRGRCNDLPFNLEVLRTHHSFITQTRPVPTSLPPSRRRIELEEGAHPAPSGLAFRPHQNPRLRVLTLTDVPRHSLGRVTDSLKSLLHSAADQEWHLRRVASADRRAPRLFPGLRVVRLEFRGERGGAGGSATGDADADAFVAESARDFSFFPEEGVGERMAWRGTRGAEASMGVVLDVVEDLRRFRSATGDGTARSAHWTGQLQCVT